MSELQDKLSFRHVVVGIDEDGRSDYAIRAALPLAEKLGAKLDLIHAVNKPSTRWRNADPIRIAASNAEALTQAWKNLRAQFAEKFAGQTFDGQTLETLCRVLPGNPAKLLLDQTASISDSRGIIFVGPHKSRGILDFGSTARSILASSKYPVWIQPEEPRPISRILVPIDLSDDCMETLSVGLALAKALDAELTILHCFMTPSFAYSANPEYPDLSPTYVIDDLRESTELYFNRIIDSFDWQGAMYRTQFETGEPTPTVLDMENNTDLIVIGTHGSTSFTSAVLGSTAYEVIRRAKRPVVAVRHSQTNWLL